MRNRRTIPVFGFLDQLRPCRTIFPSLGRQQGLQCGSVTWKNGNVFSFSKNAWWQYHWWKGSHGLCHVLVKISSLAFPSDIFPFLSFWIWVGNVFRVPVEGYRFSSFSTCPQKKKSPQKWNLIDQGKINVAVNGQRQRNVLESRCSLILTLSSILFNLQCWEGYHL